MYLAYCYHMLIVSCVCFFPLNRKAQYDFVYKLMKIFHYH